MSGFLIKLAVYLLIVGVPYGWVQYELVTQNDAFYWKSTYASNTLVLGGSRAMKGVSPDILKESWSLKHEALNLGFTGVHSPYGNAYSRLVKRKILHRSDEDHRFILSVNPGLIMDFADARQPREKDFGFYDLYMVNTHPNMEYIFRQPRDVKPLFFKWLDFDRETLDARKTVFKNGYVETHSTAQDNKELANREQLIKYDMVRSAEREGQLTQLVTDLSEVGEVYLVRLPVSLKMLEEENKLYREFNGKMRAIAESSDRVFFLNFARRKGAARFEFSDGHHHLTGESARGFTQQLVSRIGKDK